MTNGHAAHGAGGHHAMQMLRREHAEKIGRGLPPGINERYGNSLTSFTNLGDIIHAKSIHNRDLLIRLQQAQREAIAEAEADKRMRSIREVGLREFLRSKLQRKTQAARGIRNRPQELQKIIDAIQQETSILGNLQRQFHQYVPPAEDESHYHNEDLHELITGHMQEVRELTRHLRTTQHPTHALPIRLAAGETINWQFRLGRRELGILARAAEAHQMLHPPTHTPPAQHPPQQPLAQLPGTRIKQLPPHT